MKNNLQKKAKKIEKLEPIVISPREAEWVTAEEIAVYLFYMTLKINEIIERLNED